MLGIHHFGLFAGAVVLIALTPGPDTLYILGRTLAQGKRGGLLSVAGITLGCLTHTVAAAAGLSALIYASAVAFTGVKLLGAAYLAYLGWRLLRARSGSFRGGGAVEGLPPLPARRIFLQGYLTNVLNPKVALFFLAFLPQFLDPAASEAAHLSAWAFLMLGLLFTVIGNLWNLALVAGAAPFVRMIGRHPGLEAGIDRVTGAVFVALGLRLAWASR
ncbi:Threonine/homoserine/homoserine lactone efflux protein [Verrucomicrobium sp. GAS474]|uniref:LysE family translocator n=1 Tax=Verrucomicrobium sp. GAS474 TaxID=1882831 RepID=UPI00087D5804|nr:LysE family translocator [Verrucomicrobium sp. GAS474]SDT91847.1 Threonine/homoserine/homoserine lactone efflux protein [Verrucomicrobium sp. GAS474]